jgi:hypothetical protein
VKVCLDTGVEPGSIIYLCLNTNTGSDAVVKFVGIEELALVEQDVSRFTYKSIHEGKSEFRTFVDVDGSSMAFIEVPLMFFLVDCMTFRWKESLCFSTRIRMEVVV